MSSFEHGRFSVIHKAQHLYRHTLDDYAYVNPSIPMVSTPVEALNYLFQVLYPNLKAQVANPAALPLIGNSLGDMRVVLDDGDGKVAAYRWLQQEGEATPSWHKVYDLDWGAGSILQSFYDIAQDQFVVVNGNEARDPSGAIIVGLYSGQHIYGGTVAGQNLTLYANSGDGVGVRTGYVQVDDNFRPTINETFNSGDSTFRWLKSFQKSAEIGYLTIADGVGKTSITSTQPLVDFNTLNLITSGEIKSNTEKVISSIEVGPYAGNALVLSAGSITDESGAISFSSTNLTTTGEIKSNTEKVISSIEVGPYAGNTLVLAPGSITDESGAISFSAINLTTTGEIKSNTEKVITSIEVGPYAGNALVLSAGSVTDESGAISFDNENLTTTGTFSANTVTGTTSSKGGNLLLSGNVLSSTDTDGNITFTPNGTGNIITSNGLNPAVDNTKALGSATYRFSSIYLRTGISDGTNSFAISELLALRSVAFRDAARTSPVQVGDGIFWNGTQWLANTPDTEVKHELIAGLYSGAAIPSTNPDAGHPQFSLLAGRSGGQSIQGGIAASENLVLESTAHATKGLVETKDSFVAYTNASYGGGVWSGIDLGGTSNYFRNLYTKGQAIGLRFENVTSAPSFDAQTPGKLQYNTTTHEVYINTGSAIISLKSLAWAQEIPTGLINGSNDTFAPSHTPLAADAIVVYDDGVKVDRAGWVFSGGNVVFQAGYIPAAGHTVELYYPYSL